MGTCSQTRSATSYLVRMHSKLVAGAALPAAATRLLNSEVISPSPIYYPQGIEFESVMQHNYLVPLDYVHNSSQRERLTWHRI
jgi:hypothetical protein